MGQVTQECSMRKGTAADFMLKEVKKFSLSLINVYGNIGDLHTVAVIITLGNNDKGFSIVNPPLQIF